MPRYIIAFVTAKPSLIHKFVEMDSRDAALRYFFQHYVGSDYSQDADGYTYFLEDFDNPEEPLGSILEV